ncbi:MAG: guanylate kinase [Kofleriaceae bacterium]|nr:guanylate kinase [Kofleriaceae bacterium]MCL4225276.1 guanylate kinase [Myxococcales bacterium]
MMSATPDAAVTTPPSSLHLDAPPLRGRGSLIIVSSPSGAGKTTLTRRLLAELPTIDFSVSYTTRPRRAGERDGVDYHFVDGAHFDRMVAGDELAESFEVHGNRYGTARAPIDAAIARGRDMIFDVDYQGANSLARQWPADSVRIFILPPDLVTLEARLRQRATDTAEVIARRLAKAIEELRQFEAYDHLIVNRELEPAYQVLRAIYLTRRYGEVDRPDVPLPLAELAARVAANRASDPAAHARALVS